MHIKKNSLYFIRLHTQYINCDGIRPAIVYFLEVCFLSRYTSGILKKITVVMSKSSFKRIMARELYNQCSETNGDYGIHYSLPVNINKSQQHFPKTIFGQQSKKKEFKPIQLCVVVCGHCNMGWTERMRYNQWQSKHLPICTEYNKKITIL